MLRRKEVVREGFFKEITFTMDLTVRVGEGCSSRGNSQCKGP